MVPRLTTLAGCDGLSPVNSKAHRSSLLACATLMAALVVGCTSGTSGESAADPTVSLAAADAGPLAIPSGSSAQVSAAVSAALFESSPAVIVVDSDTAADVVETATDLGLPVLAVSPSPDADSGDGASQPTSATASSTSSSGEPTGTETNSGTETNAGTQTNTNSGSSSATGTEDSSDAEQTVTQILADEIERLGATHALVLGDQAREATADLDLEVVTDAGDLPDIDKASPRPTTAVLTAGPEVSQLDETALDAAAASAGAAGATFIQTTSGDPRGDTSAIDTLSSVHPNRVIGVGDGLGSEDEFVQRVAVASTGVQLPGGGQLVTPGKVYVAMYGHPGSSALGVLGEQGLDESVDRARSLAAPYRDLTSSTVIPTFEIITTVALGSATEEGDYTREVEPEFIQPWIERAQAEGMYVILDLQPGRDDLLDHAQHYESLLSYPNVGLAIDPEWKLGPNERPLQQIGSVDAEEINRVGDYLATLTREKDLPEKLFVLHQFRLDMITNRAEVNTSHDELQVLIHVDGQGAQGDKTKTWNALQVNQPANVVWGWKNFYDEDRPMLNPERTMQVEPTPVMISYQ